MAPLWEQARILADQLTGENPEASFRGLKLSTKLKIMGVDLAVMGDKDPQTDADELVHYSEPTRGVYKKLIIRDGRLAGAILLGRRPDFPNVLQTFDRGDLLPGNRASLLFPGTCGLHQIDVADLPETAQICNCNGVTKGRIVQACQEGNDTVAAVCAATRAGTGCGACKPQVKAILKFAARQTVPQSEPSFSGNVDEQELLPEIPDQMLTRPLEPILAGRN